MANITLLLAIRNLRRNLRRTFAILTTIGVGTAALFIFDGFNAGIMNQYRKNTIHARYGDGQINTKGYRDKVFPKPWDHWIETPQPVREKVLSYPGVSQIFPRLQFYGLLTNGEITLSGRGQGIDGEEEARFFTALNIVSGVNLTGEPDGIILGKGLARSLDAKVGDRITVLVNTIHGSINGLDLYVTGVFHTGTKEFDDVVFRLPLTAAQELMDTKKVESIAIGLDEGGVWSDVARRFAEDFPDLDATPFEVLDKVYYQHAVDWLNSQFTVIKVIILLIVILGIFNTISTCFMERKQEVGNLRANGESKAQVLALFMAEGSVQAIAGIAAGLLASVALTHTLLSEGILMPPSPGLTRQFYVFIELQSSGAFETAGLILVSCLIGTWFAGWRVASMPIGRALRSSS